MTYKFITEKLQIPKELKKNYKLSDAQREEIKVKYSIGVSSRKLGEEYNVNKTSILCIVNPKIKERMFKYYLQNRKTFDSYKKSKEYKRKTEHRKQKLFLEGKLIKK
jgi:hypothetical protein